MTGSNVTMQTYGNKGLLERRRANGGNIGGDILSANFIDSCAPVRPTCRTSNRLGGLPVPSTASSPRSCLRRRDLNAGAVVHPSLLSFSSTPKPLVHLRRYSRSLNEIWQPLWSISFQCRKIYENHWRIFTQISVVLNVLIGLINSFIHVFTF